MFFSRLLFAFVIWKVRGPSGFLAPDSGAYLALAQSLLHGSFSDNGIPHIIRTPGYPLLLVPAVAFGHILVIGIFENLLLAVGSAWLIWRIVGSLFPGSQASEWAVLLYCLEPVGFLNSVVVLSETLFCALLLLFIWLVIRFFNEPSYRRLLLAALTLGCATYARPVTLYLGVWLIPVFLLFPRRLPLVHRSFRTIIFLVVFASTLAPWVLRNAKAADYRGFSSISDLSLYFYSTAAVLAKLEHKSFTQEQEELGYFDNQRYLQAHREQSTWSRGQISHFMGAESRRIISQHWSSYLPICARGAIIMLLDTGATAILHAVRLYPERGGLLSRTADQGLYRGMIWLVQQYPIVGLAFLFLGIQLFLYYVLALLGVRQLPFAVGCFFASLVLYFVLVSAGPAATARFRGPVMPLVCMSAGVAIANWRAARRSRQDNDGAR